MLKDTDKAALQEAGLMRAFCAKREELANNGHDRAEAQQLALEEFLPQCGTPSTGTPKPKRQSKLVPASIFEGKSSGIDEAVSWVAANLELSGVGPKSAPSSTAWSMFQWARKSDINRSEFWRVLFPKLMPTRSSVDTERVPFRDDGRDLTKTPFFIWLEEKYGSQSAEVKQYEDDPPMPPDPSTERLLALMDKDLAELEAQKKAGTASYDPFAPGAFMGVGPDGKTRYNPKAGVVETAELPAETDAAAEG